jgi:hypothetical protein
MGNSKPVYYFGYNIIFFMQHFLHNEPVVGIEYEAQLQKTLLPRELIYRVFFCLLSSDIKFLDVFR